MGYSASGCEAGSGGKRMKLNSIARKLFALCMVVAMLTSMAVPAFADEPVVIDESIVPCTGVEGCMAATHNEGCPAVAPVVVPCTGVEGCMAEIHNEGCPAAAPVVVPCTGAEDCAAESHNEGCLKAEADFIAGIQAMIDALKTEVKQSELDAAWAEYENVTAIISALSDEQRAKLDLRCHAHDHTGAFRGCYRWNRLSHHSGCC